MNNLTSKIKALPENIQDILFSEVGREIEIDIFESNNLEGNIFNVGQIVMEMYLKELPFNNLESRVFQEFKGDENDLKKAVVDIVGRRLLIADNYFDSQASNFILKRSETLESYKKDIDAVKEELNAPEENVEDEILNEEFKSEFPEYDLEREKRDSIEVFGQDFATILNSKEKTFFSQWNDVLIGSMLEDDKFKLDIKKALLNNQEVLTSGSFVLDERTAKPTIANWIEDFKRSQRKGEFGDIEISKYLASSENAKEISIEEKELVAKLLKIYKNIKFFPDIFMDEPFETWAILPTTKEENEELEESEAEENIQKTVLPEKDIEKNVLENIELSMPEMELNKSESENISGQTFPSLEKEIKETIAGIKPKEFENVKLTGNFKDEKIKNDENLVSSKIGKNKINFRNSLVEPTVKNWLLNYKKFTANKPGSLQARINFLNNFEDAKALSMLDKEMLGLIIKSYDEGLNLNIEVKEDGFLEVDLPKREIKTEDLIMAESYVLTGDKKKEASTVKPEKIVAQKEPEIDFKQDKKEISESKTDLKLEKFETQTPQQKTSQILNILKNNFKDKDLELRLRSIVLTRVKNIRDKAKTREILQRASNSGGLGLSEKDADYFIRVIENVLAGKSVEEKDSMIHDIAPKRRKNPQVEKPEYSKEIEEIEKRFFEDNVEKDASKKFSSSEKKSFSNRKENVVFEAKPAKPSTMDVSFDKKPKVESKNSEIEKVLKSKPIVSSPTEVKSDKIVRDVSISSKVVGPIGELKVLDVEDFRRLGDSASSRVEKIRNKISILEDESLIKKSEGIEAWKNSEVYKLYRKIGQESLLKGKDVNSIISERKSSGNSYLTKEEFDAIGDLNKTLRF